MKGSCRKWALCVLERHLAFAGFLAMFLASTIVVADPGGVADPDAG